MKQNRIMQFLQYVKPMVDYRVSYENEHHGMVELSVSQPFKEEYQRIGTEVIIRFGKWITVELHPEAMGDPIFGECKTVNELLAWMQQNQHKQFVSAQPVWY